MDGSAVSRLSAAHLRAVISGKVGRVWVAARNALADNDVTGAHMAQHIGSTEGVLRFFSEGMRCELTPVVAEELRALVLATASAAPAANAALARGDDRDKDKDKDKGTRQGQGTRQGGWRGGGLRQDGGEDSDSDSDSDSDDSVSSLARSLASLRQQLGGAGAGTSFFRSRNRVTGQTIAFSAKKVPEDNAAKEDYLRGLAQECANDYGWDVADVEILGDGTRPDVPKLGMHMSVHNTRTGVVADIVVQTKDPDAISHNVAERQRFQQSVQYDMCQSRGWDRADTVVSFAPGIALPQPRTYQFHAVNLATRQRAFFSVNTHDGNFEYGNDAAKAAFMRELQQQYAASEGWPADQTYVYGDGRVHIKHPIGAALQATNTVTGETKTTGISTCDPDAFSEDATVRQAFLTGQQIEYAREVGWPTNNTVLQFTGDIRLPKKRRYHFRATNRATDQERLFTVKTTDGTYEYGGAAGKAAFLARVAESRAASSSWRVEDTVVTPFRGADADDVKEDGNCRIS